MTLSSRPNYHTLETKPVADFIWRDKLMEHGTKKPRLKDFGWGKCRPQILERPELILGAIKPNMGVMIDDL